jgi:hypothetical protein
MVGCVVQAEISQLSKAIGHVAGRITENGCFPIQYGDNFIISP